MYAIRSYYVLSAHGSDGYAELCAHRARTTRQHGWWWQLTVVQFGPVVTLWILAGVQIIKQALAQIAHQVGVNGLPALQIG